MIKNLLFGIITLLPLSAQETEPVSWTYDLTKLNSLEYENPVNKENEIIIKNEIPMKSSNKKNKLLYLKFDNIDINKASIKNSKYINIDSKDCVFEIGKNYLDEIMIFYKKPLHGLIAFAICILKLLN